MRLAQIFAADNRGFYLLIMGMSLCSSGIVWFNYGQVFDISSLQQLWTIKTAPETWFHYLLRPFALGGEAWVVFAIAVFTAIIMVQFAKISTMIGIGHKALFTLFLFLNFLPEFNHVRFAVTPFWLGLSAWLSAIGCFLFYYPARFYRGFCLWAGFSWLAGFCDPIFFFWALGFPLCFLFWAGKNHRWWELLWERGRFLLVYYALIAIVIALVPAWSSSFINSAILLFNRIQKTAIVVSSLFNRDNSAVVSFILAMAFIALDVIKTAGVLVLILIWISHDRGISSILSPQIKHFFGLLLFFAWLTHTACVFYRGALLSSLYYLLILLPILWLCAGGASYLVHRLLSGKMPPQRAVVMWWLLVALAIASMVQFGPSADYQRLAGNYLAQLAPERVLSNSKTALYYARTAPDDQHFKTLSEFLTAAHHYPPETYYIFRHHRNDPVPAVLSQQTIIAEFANRHGDKAYILKVTK